MIDEKMEEKLKDLYKAIESAGHDYKEKIKLNADLDEKYKLKLKDIDGLAKDLEVRETALKNKFDELNNDFRKVKQDEGDNRKRFGEYTTACKTLADNKALLEQAKKEFGVKQEEFKRQMEREQARLAEAETTAKTLTKIQKDKINELEDLRTKHSAEIKAELSKLKSLAGDLDVGEMEKKTTALKDKMILAEQHRKEAEKLRNEYQIKLATYRDRSGEIDKRKTLLDKMESEITGLMSGMKLREEAVKEREEAVKINEKDYEDKKIYLEALNRKVDQKIEIHKLAKELGIGTEE